MNDKQITRMLFKPCNDRVDFLKWITSELSGTETVSSSKEMLNILLKFVYIPREFHTAFIEGTMICQKELHCKIWDAVFHELTLKKQKVKLNENQDPIDSDCLISSKATGQEQSEPNELSSETAHLLSEWESLCKKEKNYLCEVQQGSLLNGDFNIGNYLKHIQKFIEQYEMESILLKNKDFKNITKLEHLQLTIPSLCSSTSTIEKVNEDGKTIIKCLEKFKELQMNNVDVGDKCPNKERFTNLFKGISDFLKKE